ncbi:hypothetical protein GQ543_03595 [candidate division WOR-3 bacterium]|nr:hypothetical protein [candidate division WOR-3 bacterium]
MKKAVHFLFFLFLIISCGRPEPPEEEIHTFEIIGSCSLPGYAEDIDIANNLAYVANDQGGLQIVNISNPESTFIVGEYMSEKSIVGVSVRDTFAYLAVSHSQGGVRIINVAQPEEPIFVGEDNWYYGYDVMAPQNDTMFVYVAGGYWFVVENVSDPQYPSFVRRWSTPGNVRCVYVVDSIAYLACEQMGLHIFNLAKPDSEALVGWIDTPSHARDVFVQNNLAYIADGRAGLIIIDVSNPEYPELKGTYNTPDYANDVFVYNNLAYIADGEGGLQVINIIDPEDPVFYGEIEISYANSVYVKNDYIYVADRDIGLVIIIEEKE